MTPSSTINNNINIHLEALEMKVNYRLQPDRQKYTPNSDIGR